MNMSLYLRVSGSWWREALSHTIGTMRGPNTPVEPPREQMRRTRYAMSLRVRSPSLAIDRSKTIKRT